MLGTHSPKTDLHVQETRKVAQTVSPAGPISHCLLLCLVLTGTVCLMDAGSAKAFPWSIDMFREPAVQPLTVSPRVMPPGTMPVDGERPRSTIASLRMRNRLSPLPKYLERGRELFAINCAVCHGAEGNGDGPVKFLLRMPPVNLTSRPIIHMKDGYMYGVIRNGAQVMPPYGDALSPTERWEVVLFIRDLQHQAAAGKQDHASTVR
jgi:cytochrome c553